MSNPSQIAHISPINTNVGSSDERFCRLTALFRDVIKAASACVEGRCGIPGTVLDTTGVTSFVTCSSNVHPMPGRYCSVGGFSCFFRGTRAPPVVYSNGTATCEFFRSVVTAGY